MKILNLYAGIGGNRKLWGDEHEVTAVEKDINICGVYRELFPHDEVICGDAHQYLLDHYQDYDFIWTSPPCLTRSLARYGLKVCSGKARPVYPDFKLYEEIVFLKHHFNGKWVVENVQAHYKPPIKPQPIGRHWYWANFEIPNKKVKSLSLCSTTTKAGTKLCEATVDQLQQRLGIDLSGFAVKNKRLLLRNCVEPEIGKYILERAEDGK
jgi:DNA (cytosine-5)-methyltransferase 1